MSIVKKAGRKKPYYYVISTGQKLPNGRYEKITYYVLMVSQHLHL